MPKANKSAKPSFVCRECGGVVTKWQGQCPHCKEWNTLDELPATSVIASAAAAASSARTSFNRSSRLDDINEFSASIFSEPASGGFGGIPLAAATEIQELNQVEMETLPRIESGFSEFDRVLGGGLVPGGVVLIGGDPGIGKSTLLLQTLCALHNSGNRTLYVTGEESVSQIGLRATRVLSNVPDLPVVSETRLERILSLFLTQRPQISVIDSIQTMATETASSAPGSVTQVRECAGRLTQFAKQTQTTVILVGHVTKEGAIAGPRILEHMVDTVLYFEGDTHSAFRLIRATKNRFGAVGELGVFAMTDKGIKGVSNPSSLFLPHRPKAAAGACILIAQEGTRSILVEIQALADKTYLPSPKRLTVGLEQNRLGMLIAVLHRHAGISCADQDVFVNAVGGVRVSEPASDLAVMLAIVSSLKNRPLPNGLAIFGEIGLTGEIRPAPRGQERVREAQKLGFTQVILPRPNMPKKPIEGLRLIPVDHVADAIEWAGL